MGIKKYSDEEKLGIVLKALTNVEHKTQLCKQHGISRMSLDKWIERFVAGGKAAFHRQPRNHENIELFNLHKENEELKLALAERELDLRALKKKA